jgi:2'-5' RNA ligase
LNDTHVKLFFALWPGDEVRRAMWQTGGKLYEVWNGRRMKPDTLHMTLVFLGDTPVARVDELKAVASRMQGHRFDLVYRQAACWRHNKVGFLSPEDTPPALVQLVYGLEESLEAAGFTFDQRPYKPHVTLLRNTRCTTQVAFEPIRWRPEEFVLVASNTTDHGPTYQLLGRWKLSP